MPRRHAPRIVGDSDDYHCRKDEVNLLVRAAEQRLGPPVEPPPLQHFEDSALPFRPG